MAPEKRRVSLVSDEQKRKLIEDNAIRVANMDKTMVFNKPSSSLPPRLESRLLQNELK